MRFVLDAGALVAVDRHDRAVGAMLRVAQEGGVALLTSSAAVAQVWRNGPRQANLARLLAGVRTVGLSPESGRAVGLLLGADGSSDVVDAHVASLAGPGDVILTSDPDDLGRLIATRGLAATVRAV